MDTLNKVFLYSHILCGFASLVIGLMVSFIFKKGDQRHRLLGRVYFISMTGTFVFAILLLVFFRFQVFLFAIAIFSYYMAYGGFRSIRLRKTAQPQFIDWIAAALAIVSGTGLMIYGSRVFYITGGFHVLGMLCLIFGFFTVRTAVGDIRGKFKKDKEALWWLYQHIQAMSGSLIAATTAFCVTSLNFIIPGTSMDWVLWLLPSAIGAPAIAVTIRKLKLGNSIKASQVP